MAATIIDALQVVDQVIEACSRLFITLKPSINLEDKIVRLPIFLIRQDIAAAIHHAKAHGASSGVILKLTARCLRFLASPNFDASVEETQEFFNDILNFEDPNCILNSITNLIISIEQTITDCGCFANFQPFSRHNALNICTHRTFRHLECAELNAEVAKLIQSIRLREIFGEFVAAVLAARAVIATIGDNDWPADCPINADDEEIDVDAEEDGEVDSVYPYGHEETDSDMSDRDATDSCDED